MFEIIASPFGFSILFSLFAAGAFGSLVLFKRDRLANLWSSFFSIAGSAWGLLFAGSTLISGQDFAFSFGKPFFPLLSLSFHIDLLSSFFILVISLVAFFCSIYGISYVRHFYATYSIGTLGFLYNVAIASLLLIVTAANGLLFLIVWEIASISSYFIVAYDRNDADNVKAGALYLIMAYAGTAFLILAFLLLYTYTGSFDFAAIKSGAALIPSGVKDIVFIFALIGLGTKAGIIPFHIWLPSAHPAAPSHFSALMSSVVIKTGIYMMIRLFLDLLQPIPLWWGETVLIIGAVSALLGVLYALTEHDIKRLLAYHSIENIGIILLGLGSALTFYSLNMPTLALLGLVAALFHTLNHAVFKSLLFLSAGSVINETHTRNMEEYGGLIRYMPQTAIFFLVGSMAISALPPFNGFFSEWMTFQVLFQGISQLPFSIQWIFVLAAGSLAFTGGLALACFVKAFGAIFLARPRSVEVTHAKESALSMRLGMAGLATLSLLFGVFSGSVVVLLEKVGRGFSIFQSTPSFVSVSAAQSISAGNGFAQVSAPWILWLLVAITLGVAFVVRFLINRKQKIVVGATWDCGTELTPRMEITATGFARSIILIFKGVLKPSIQHDIEYHDAASRYMPKSRTVTLGVGDVYDSYFYKPLYDMLDGLSARLRNIQIGNINIYISYLFIALIVALFIIL